MSARNMSHSNENSKRIAIAFRGIGDIGGTNNTIAEHARMLTAMGYQVDLLGQKVHKGGVSPDMGSAIRIPQLHLMRRYKWRWFAWQTRRRLESGRYDFVAGHGHHYRQHVLSMHNCLHLTCELTHGKALDPEGGLAEIHDRIFAQQSFELCIANSRLMRDDLTRRYGVDPQWLRVIYPGYRSQQFNIADRAQYRDSVRNELGVQDRVLIGLITSGDFAKRGLDILLSAFSGLAEELRTRCALLVLGKQNGAGRFKELAQTLGVAEQITFVGSTRQPERYFHALDFCVHPARFEEFGQSVQEAIASGVPVVSTRRVGATEMLPEDMRAELPDAPDADTLQAQLQHMIEASPEQRRNMAQRARDAVVGNTVEANFEKTLEVYRQAGL